MEGMTLAEFAKTIGISASLARKWKQRGKIKQGRWGAWILDTDGANLPPERSVTITKHTVLSPSHSVTVVRHEPVPLQDRIAIDAKGAPHLSAPVSFPLIEGNRDDGMIHLKPDTFRISELENEVQDLKRRLARLEEMAARAEFG